MWRAWSQRQWDRWGSKLQDKYDEIDAWEDEDIKKMLSALWTIVPANVKHTLTAFIVEVYNKYGAEFARNLLKKIFPDFEKQQ